MQILVQKAKTSLDRPYQIIICGQSIFLMAIEASLAALPEVEVERVALYLPDLAEWVVARQPELVLVEAGADCGDLRQNLLDWGIPVAELYPNSEQTTLFTSHRYPISEPDSLLHIIGQIQRFQEVL